MQEDTVEQSERQQELAALARLISHARKCAEDIGAEDVTKSLNVALIALLDEVDDPSLPEALLASEPPQAAN